MPQVAEEEISARVAVFDFDVTAIESDPASIVGFMALLQAGLADSPDYDLVSPEYVAEIRTNAFGDGSGSLESDQRLGVGRDSGATHVLTGEIREEQSQHQAVWRIIDAQDGSVENSGVTEAAEWTDLTRFAVRDIRDSFGGRQRGRSRASALRGRTRGARRGTNPRSAELLPRCRGAGLDLRTRRV
jgi:hypothetical protein